MVAKTKAEKQKLKVLTPEFRVSFPQMFEARKVNETDLKAKFSLQMLFRVKADPAKPHEKIVDLAPLKAVVQALLIENLGPDWSGKVQQRKSDGSAMYKLPFRDGGAPEKKDQDGFGPGIIFCSASSIYKPGLVDASNQDIISPSEFYGGCYARATVNPYWFSIRGNTGIALGLQNVQKLRDGEPISGRSRPQEDFDAITPPEGASAVEGGGTGAMVDPLMP